MSNDKQTDVSKGNEGKAQVDALVSWPLIDQEVEDIHHGGIGTVIRTYIENGVEYARVDWGMFEKDVSTRSLKEVDS